MSQNENNARQFAIEFASFCKESELYPKQAMQVCILADKVFKAEVRACNETMCDSDNESKELEEYVKSIENYYQVRYTGLHPSLWNEDKGYIDIPSLEE